MALTKLQLLAIGIAAIVGVALVVGLSVGLTVGRRKTTEPISNAQRALDILKSHPLIDGHNDLAWFLRDQFQNIINGLDLNNITQYSANLTAPTHTDINRLREGQVGGQFWSIYTSCQHQGKDATVSFLEQIDVMNRVIEKYPNVFKLVKTAAEAREAFKNGYIASLYGIEGGQAIESSFGILRLFYQLGVRYMTLTHNCNNPWADQNQVDRVDSTHTKNEGLTEYGKRVIKEMNRLGMLVDLSHVSKQTMLDVLNVTASPVIFSHSSVHAICNHTRNVHDDVLKLVKKNGGVVMVVFASLFATCNSTNLGNITDVVAHINHIKNIASIDNIGLGGDYDGVDALPTDLKDVSTYPKLVEYLIGTEKWSEEDVIKLIGGNVLRVLEENEQKAKELQSTTEPQEGLIPKDDLIKFNMTECRHLDMYLNATDA